MADTADAGPGESSAQPSGREHAQTCAACGKQAAGCQPYRFVVAEKIAETSTQSGNRITTTTTYQGPFLERTLYFSDDCVAQARGWQLRFHFGFAAGALLLAVIAFLVGPHSNRSTQQCLAPWAVVFIVAFIGFALSAIPWLRREVREKRLGTLFSNEISAEARRLKPSTSPERIVTFWAPDFRKAYPDKQITEVD